MDPARPPRPSASRAFLLIALTLEIFLALLYLALGTATNTAPLAPAFTLAALAALPAAFALSRLLVPGQTDPESTSSAELAVLEERLALNRQNLEAVLEHAGVGFVLLDSEGSVVLSNPVIAELFALSEEESRAASISHLLRHFQFVELWRQVAQSGRAQTLTAEVPQSRRIVRARAFPLRGVRPGRALMVFEDISELRRLETIRRDFVSNVSHELRTPLTSLKAIAESLRAGALEEPERARRFLGHIETEVDALSELVAELLELARIESQSVPLQLQSSDPCEILHRAVERLALQAERADLDMEITCPGALPEVLADPPRLEQVLVNLLHNAIKFTPGSGRIWAGVEPLDGVLRFYVRDTGIGISEEDLPRVFERFYKTDQARKDKGGTGLGLAISKHIVEAHEGRIWAESRLGQGSTFYFTVPTPT